MEALGDAKFYADYYRTCGSVAQPKLLRWLELEDPKLAKQVVALVEKQEKKRGD